MTSAWWKEAVFYQIYPRSFADANGDGIGDLAGVISRLDYLAWLGVDCLWLSPVFDSPNEDMGYDVRDYRAIMAEMGTMADMDALIAGCHNRGMRIILDLVANHTSEQHDWFRKALADPDGPYGDYYVLRRGTTPPNNWESFFSGSAWRYFDEADRWALHLFAPGQLDLNWDNPAVRAEIADIVQFWRAKGIDGFRMDVTNYISKAPGLPEGNEFIGELIGFTGIEHYFYGPKLHDYLAELRRDGFTSPDGEGGIMVGETPGIGVETGRLLSGADRAALDLVFNFDVLEPPGKIRWDDYRYDLAYLVRFYRDYLERIGSNDWIALFVENHDNPRMISKVLGQADRDPALRDAVGVLIATVQLTLPGTPFIFQGQEVASVNQPFADLSELRDVESINHYAKLIADGTSPADAWAEILAGSRDHARTPIAWEPGGGFTIGTPWLAQSDPGPGYSVAEQRANPDSVLNAYRELIALRRAHPAFVYGDVTFLASGERGYAAWLRTSPDGTERWLIELNTTGKAIPRRIADGPCEIALGPPTRGERMRPYEAVVARLLPR
ncbi:hypothetical protein BSZ39_12230 [Bowdeniella nasicola]|uniref:Glycosyl hydrolase family 13 catalytic domain-containing protein n=1 Tax=Bowdeniella nasicola TaxID=208480 RepID=A0A1Q5PZN2_9ACTO|nr:hypothetical protein BSZ39_12230 [Bowdeniella nasicola]